MAIQQISLNDFRNLKSATIDLHDKLNIITGLNASGKTSFLEAIHIICQGRSFKTHLLNQCIQKEKNNFLLFANFTNYKAGFSRSRNKTIIRVDNETIQRVSLLAKRTPVKIINMDCLNLILGSPSYKREFLDWGLFHVEPDYQSLWSHHKHALKQRNALLKQKKNISELEYWDKYMSQFGTKIYELRSKFISALQNIIDTDFSDITAESPINLKYEPGWDTSLSLVETLKINARKDTLYGYTRKGVHRDDIKIHCDNINVNSYFSRGQIKKISILLYLAQILLVLKSTGQRTILLIDDIDSELDDISIHEIIKSLSGIDIQIFITTINNNTELTKYHEEYNMFHVEHGMIKAVKNTRETHVRI